MSKYNLNDNDKCVILDGFAKKFMNEDISEMSLAKKENHIASWFAFEVDYGTPITKCGLATRMVLFSEWIDKNMREHKITPMEGSVINEVSNKVHNEVFYHQVAREIIKLDILKNAPMEKGDDEEYDKFCEFKVGVDDMELSGILFDCGDKYHVMTQYFEFYIVKDGMEDLAKAIVVC